MEDLVYGEFPIDAFHRLCDAACEDLVTSEAPFATSAAVQVVSSSLRPCAAAGGAASA